MPPRLALTLLALFAAVGLFAIWLWSPGARPPPATSIELEPLARSPRDDRQELADLATPSEAAEPSASGARVGVEAPAAQALRGAADEPLGLVVHGVIRGAGLDLGQAELSLFEKVSGPTQVLRVRPDDSGRYEIDATELLSTRVFIGNGADLELVLSHPWCATTRRVLRVLSPQLAGTNRRARLGLDSDGTFERVSLEPGLNRYQIDLQLLESARVHGSLVSALHPGRHRMVSVGAARPDDPEALGQWFARTGTDVRGEFELRLPPGARYAIVVTALDQRPVTQWIDLPLPGDYTVALTSDAGMTISGRIEIADGLAQQGIGLELFLDHAPEDGDGTAWQPTASIWGEVVWTQGAFEWARRTTRVRADGSFSIDGLAERDYELRVLAVGLPDVELRAFSAARLRAPAAGVELGPYLASLSLDLGPAPEGPLRFVLIESGSGNRIPLGPYLTDARGAARLFLPPRATYDVQVGRDVVGRVTTGAVGEHGLWALSR